MEPVQTIRLLIQPFAGFRRRAVPLKGGLRPPEGAARRRRRPRKHSADVHSARLQGELPLSPYAARGRRIRGCGRRKERDVRRVASVSFGKDSLAALLLLLEQNERLDEVIFYNSGMEFQAIYDIRDRIKPILEQRGIRFAEVKPGAPFLYNMLDRPVHSKKNGFHLGYGWCGGPCRWGTKLKTRSLDGVALDADIHYVGIAADETERLARLEPPKCSPLAEAGMTEADCLAFCYARGFFWEKEGIRLYDILDRVSCWCCKNKNRKELKAIYQFLPQYWERLKGLQAQILQPMKPYSRKGVPYGNVFDLEKVFEQEIQAEENGGALKEKRRQHEQSR